MIAIARLILPKICTLMINCYLQLNSHIDRVSPLSGQTIFMADAKLIK